MKFEVHHNIIYFYPRFANRLRKQHKKATEYSIQLDENFTVVQQPIGKFTFN